MRVIMVIMGVGVLFTIIRYACAILPYIVFIPNFVMCHHFLRIRSRENFIIRPTRPSLNRTSLRVTKDVNYTWESVCD